MKAAYPLLAGIALTASAFAEKPADPKAQPEVSDAVQKAIGEFNRRKAETKAKANEVVVVLDPPAPPADTAGEDTPAPATDAEDEGIPAAKIVPEPEEDSQPVLVTGKPPVPTDDQAEEGQAEEEQTGATNEGITENPEPPAEPVGETPAEPVVETPPEPVVETPAEPALEARVESIRKGTGPIDPSQVKLKASFPAKPLSTAPAGWKLERSEQAPVFRKDVELQPGTAISLSIRPHVLAPDSDGSNTFSVGEPGYEAAHGYLQENTVSAILGTSVAQLDRDSLQLGNAISELHRLLASLPKPEEPETP